MRRSKLCVLLAAMLSVMPMQEASADRSEGSATGRQGVVRCGGTNFLRLSGTEIHAVSWVLRNFDEATPITIDRMRWFDASGAVRFDTALNGFPPSDNGVLGPANQTLAPNQTSEFASEVVLPFLPQEERPVQLELQWSAVRPALSLDAVTSRRVRMRDAVTGQVQQERSRSVAECRTIVLRQGG